MVTAERIEMAQKATPGWRFALFTILVTLFAIASWTVLEGVTEGLTPWVIIGCPGCGEGAPDYNPAPQRWHGAQHGGALAFLFGGSLISLAFRGTEKPLLLQFYTYGKTLFAGLFFLSAFSPVSNLNAGAVVPFTVVLVLLTLAAAAALAYPTYRAFAMQVAGIGIGGEIEFFRWGEDAVVNILLIFAGLIAATKRPGWQNLGVITGLAYLFLGAAALTIGSAEAANWGYLGGALSLLGGVAYLVATYAESRQPA